MSYKRRDWSLHLSINSQPLNLPHSSISISLFFSFQKPPNGGAFNRREPPLLHPFPPYFVEQLPPIGCHILLPFFCEKYKTTYRILIVCFVCIESKQPNKYLLLVCAISRCFSNTITFSSLNQVCVSKVRAYRPSFRVFI